MRSVWAVKAKIYHEYASEFLKVVQNSLAGDISRSHSQLATVSESDSQF